MSRLDAGCRLMMVEDAIDKEGCTKFFFGFDEESDAGADIFDGLAIAQDVADIDDWDILTPDRYNMIVRTKCLDVRFRWAKCLDDRCDRDNKLVMCNIHNHSIQHRER